MGWYDDLQRGIVVLKCEDLSEADARRPVIPTSPLMTAAGIVSHLRRGAEQLWFEHAFLDRRFEGPGWDEIDDSEFHVGDRTLADVLGATTPSAAAATR